MTTRSRLTMLTALPFLALLAPACDAADQESDAESADSAQTGQLDASRYRPVAAWSGRLVLPSSAERRPDGAVRVELHNAAKPDLRGKTVWVRYDANGASAERVRSVTVDMRFDERTRGSEAKGNIHPKRLDGWKRVGPLESLAGARPSDDVLVALPDAKLEGDELVIAREPVIVPGDFIALVTVKGNAGAGRYKVAHYKKAANDYAGPEETLAFDAPAIPVGGNGQSLSPIDGIERSSFNASGYYAHGVIGVDGAFHVRALVPRSLRRVPTVNARYGASQSLLYTTAGMWDPIGTADAARGAKGTASTMLLVPNGVSGEVAAAQWSAATLREGAQLLVTHAFGAIGPAEQGLRTGHFSFGVGTIVREPLSGDLELDVEYRQVYAHNPNGILAGTHSWASYSGSFERGWMYSRPIADVALTIPALTRTYDMAGSRFRPLDGLVAELDTMTARYRTGNGTGASIVTPANSCVQDSSKALFFALVKLDEKVRSTPSVRAYVDGNPEDPQVKDYKTLLSLVTETERYLSPLGITRSDWRSQASELAAVSACPGGTVGAVFCALGSYRTIFPRKASDFYTEVLLRNGAGGVALRTNQIVGAMPGLFPLSPTGI